MDIELFDYHLPSDLIAQHPVRRRDESRLLVVDRATKSIATAQFSDISRYLNSGDLLIVNNTKVFKARLLGRRKTGAEVEILLVRKHPSDHPTRRWLALGRPSKRLHEGELIVFGPDGDRYLTLIESLSGGRWIVEFSGEKVEQEIISRYGHVPLPPYIERAVQPDDVDRYQTIFARADRSGAVAAPTAGFHFTEPLVTSLKAAGIAFGEVTLTVGPGTFKPVTAGRVEDHVVDPELAELPADTATRINETRASGGRVIAVGTTSVRTLESADIDSSGLVKPFSREVDLYIRPGHEFRLIDGMVTNFHLPKSSLLILVCAFADRDLIMAAYQHAVTERFRFYSYGDAMLIL